MQIKINFSGYLQQLALLSLDDLEKLLIQLRPFDFYNVSSVQTETSKRVNFEQFIAFYERYLLTLFNENIDELQELQSYFSHAIASSEGCFHKALFSEGRFLYKPVRSVIQCQPLGLFVSSIDKQIHTKTFAKDAQSFGIKYSFPTIYEDATHHHIHELKTDDPEYAKFNLLRQFIRHHTKPLIVRHGNQKTVLPVRYSEDLKLEISKMSFFSKQGLEVVV